MNVSTPIHEKKSVSFRWDINLVEHLKELARKSNRSLSKLTETLLSSAVYGTEESLPNQTTLDAIKEARQHQQLLATGKAPDDDYIDMSSMEAMIASSIE